MFTMEPRKTCLTGSLNYKGAKNMADKEIFEYLGDGVYAKFDGHGIWLLANHHEHPTDKVYLGC